MKTSARVLRLLSLLQARREWPGQELAERLEVDVRTVRRDVDRLRELGYTIDASSGPGGGYRLGAGSTTPPLLLDDDEAVAVAVALGAAAGSIANLQEVALRALTKLDQLLPPRLRRRLSALRAVTLSLSSARASADLELLTTIAAACRDQVELRFDYRDREGSASRRRVEPMRLVHTGRVWYLAAWDLERESWRTFRVDRLAAQPAPQRGPSFLPRTPPEDFVKLVSRSIAASPYRYSARLRVRGSAAEIAALVPSWIGVIEPLDARHCTLSLGGNSAEAVAGLLAQAGVEFTLLEPNELRAPLRRVATRLLRGVAGGKR